MNYEDLNNVNFMITFGPFKVVFSKSLTGLNLFLTVVADVTHRFNSFPFMEAFTSNEYGPQAV